MQGTKRSNTKQYKSVTEESENKRYVFTFKVIEARVRAAR